MNVSVIIPAYNAEQTIAEAIESVLAQTCAKWEAIVVDDGSSDATPEIVVAYSKRDKRIRIIRQANGGESAARNTGVAHARYKWLLFLDADDWISPTHIERMTAVLAAQPELDAVHCGSVRVALDGTQVTDNYQPPTGDLFPTLALRAAFPVNACIVRKSVVKGIGCFDTSLKKSADWDMWQRVARTGARFGAVREVLAYYRMLPNSASLEAEQLFYDGLTVLRRGCSPDSRVPNPHPDYRNGLSQATVESQEFYLLCWCAGLLLGSGKDARHLLKAVENDQYRGLHANALARCIFESATLPACQPPQAWEELWPRIKDPAEVFLEALETQSRTPDLARATLTELKKLILKYSSTWSSIIAQQERTIAELRDSNAQFDRCRVSVEAERDHWRQRSGTLDQDKAVLEQNLEDLRSRTEAVEQEKTSLQSALDDAKRCAAVLEHEKALLVSELDESRRSSGTLEEEKALLELNLEDSRSRMVAVEREKTSLQSALDDAKRREAVLEHEKALLVSNLDESRRRSGTLEEEKALLRLDLDESRRHVATLDEQKSHLTEELSRWRRSDGERAVIIAEIQSEKWVRLGTRLGLVKPRVVSHPAMSSASAGARGQFQENGAQETPDNQWDLRAVGGNQAHLVFSADDPEMVRIDIRKTKSRTDWDVQLNRRGLQVISNQRYAVHFRARADRPRRIGVGFAQAHEPWVSLGLYLKLNLTPEWQTFYEEFSASADDDKARIHFDLGGRNVGVELTAVTLQRMTEDHPDEFVRQNGTLA